jgi:small GTP-binding protein
MTDAQPKVVLIGEAGVGKTSIIRRAESNDFDSEAAPTVGTAFAKVTVEKYGELKIWDTAGQEAYRSLVSVYYRGAHCVIVVFAVNSRVTFESVTSWIDMLKEDMDKLPALIIVGNKTDMREDYAGNNECVGYQEALDLSQKYGAVYCETSCKTAEGIGRLVEQMAKLAFAQADREGQPQATTEPVPREDRQAQCQC